MANMEVDTFDRFIVIGDRLLIKPKEASARTKSGLYLPPTVHDADKIHSGYVIKAGPGYPVNTDPDAEPWKEPMKRVQYIPLQASEGDLAVYLSKQAYEITFNNEKYVIVTQSAVLLVIRDEDLFE